MREIDNEAPTAPYLLQSVQAPPTVTHNTATVVQQVLVPDGYKLHGWHAFSGGDPEDRWGYALLLWEREHSDSRGGCTLSVSVPSDAVECTPLPLTVRASHERNERMGLHGRDGFRVHYPGGMSVWLPDDVFAKTFTEART